MSGFIPVICPGCGYTTQVPREMGGQQAQCPSCKIVVAIPRQSMPATAPLPPQPYNAPLAPSKNKGGSGAMVGWIVGGVDAVAGLTVTLILTLGGDESSSSNGSYNTGGGYNNSSQTATSDPDVQRQIQQAADILNSVTPQRMDEYTELVEVQAGPMELIYKYRVSVNLNQAQWQQIESVVRNGLNSNPDTRNLLRMNVTMTYEYRGPNGSIGHRFSIR